MKVFPSLCVILKGGTLPDCENDATGLKSVRKRIIKLSPPILPGILSLHRSVWYAGFFVLMLSRAGFNYFITFFRMPKTPLMNVALVKTFTIWFCEVLPGLPYDVLGV